MWSLAMKQKKKKKTKKTTTKKQTSKKAVQRRANDLSNSKSTILNIGTK